MTIVVEADAPYSVEALGRIERLTQDLAVVPGVRRVDSLATVPLVYATPDGDLSLDPALKFRDYRNPTALAELVTLVRADRIARRALVSDDGRSFAVHLVLEQGADQKYDELFARLDVSLRNEVVWISGVPVFRREATRRTTRELAVFVPLTIITLSVLLWALFRSLAAIAIPIVSSSAGTWVLLGAMGALGVPLTITTVILPSIMLALGCAYCMHVLTASRGRLTRPLARSGTVAGCASGCPIEPYYGYRVRGCVIGAYRSDSRRRGLWSSGSRCRRSRNAYCGPRDACALAGAIRSLGS